MAARVCRLRSKIVASVHIVALFNKETIQKQLAMRLSRLVQVSYYTLKQVKGQRSHLLTTDQCFTIVYCLMLQKVLLCYTITTIHDNTGTCTLQYSPGLSTRPGIEASQKLTVSNTPSTNGAQQAMNLYGLFFLSFWPV